jgi:hypothetical protein
MENPRGKRKQFTRAADIPTGLDIAEEVQKRAVEVRAEKVKARRVIKALALVDFILTGA